MSEIGSSSEWSSNKFLRKLSLPAEVEAKDIEALLKDGILVST